MARVVSVAEAMLATKVWIELTRAVPYGPVIRGEDMLVFSLATRIHLFGLGVGPNLRLDGR